MGCKNVLPDPFPVCIGIFLFQRVGQVGGSIPFGEVFFVHDFDQEQILPVDLVAQPVEQFLRWRRHDETP